jgi:predicted ATPase
MLVAMGNWNLGFVLFIFGENISAQDYLGKVTDFYNPEQHHQQFVLLRGSDAGVSALAYQACVLWCLGYPDQARIKSQEAISLARTFKHPFTLADALCYGGCWFNAMLRDMQALKEYAKELIGLSKGVGFAGWETTGDPFYGEALAVSGELEEGIVRIRKGIATNELIGVRCSLIGSYRALAQAQLIVQPEQGLATLDKALTLVTETGENIWEAELYRLKGELLLLGSNEISAEASFNEAIKIAQKQSAKSWELRATISLARLWKDQGKNQQASQILGEIYSWFTEGYDTPDLKRARSLLDSLH